jgi:hypothetical protein
VLDRGSPPPRSPAPRRSPPHHARRRAEAHGVVSGLVSIIIGWWVATVVRSSLIHFSS